jgi:hypothetical protein
LNVDSVSRPGERDENLTEGRCASPANPNLNFRREDRDACFRGVVAIQQGSRAGVPLSTDEADRA